jgi:hypothetical protein
MKIKTNDLEDLALDWAVAKCLDGNVSTTDERGGWLVVFQPRTRGATGGGSPFPPMFFNPSKDWAKGGPIIEREGIALRAYDHNVQKWSAEPSINTVQTQLPAFRTGPTPLIAAMRCYVASKLGDEVEIPEELQ